MGSTENSPSISVRATPSTSCTSTSRCRRSRVTARRRPLDRGTLRAIREALIEIGTHRLKLLRAETETVSTRPIVERTGRRGGIEPMYENVLIPTDGSDDANRAADHAITLAGRYGATVHALSVINANRLGLRTPSDVDVADVRAPLRGRAERAVAVVASRASEADVPVVEAVRIGIPHQSIRDYATEHDVDLIVMGSHGRTGLERYLLGSVAERVVRTSEGPVLAVRHRES